jgi:class 3 adenylate cyclase
MSEELDDLFRSMYGLSAETPASKNSLADRILNIRKLIPPPPPPESNPFADLVLRGLNYSSPEPPSEKNSLLDLMRSFETVAPVSSPHLGRVLAPELRGLGSMRLSDLLPPPMSSSPPPPRLEALTERRRIVALKEDLEKSVGEIFRSRWDERDGNVVPDEDSVGLGNDAIKLDATVLYADLADSTKLVDNYSDSRAAEIYKAFLHCAAKIVRSEGGEITAYDGDRIMAVYIGDYRNTSAVRTAMKINYALYHIVNPANQAMYKNSSYTAAHVVGVDTSALYVARTGVRGANDLVWVGRAANYAAKLSALPSTYPTYITKEVYDVMNKEVKTSSDGKQMWEAVSWNTFDNRTIYRSNWRFRVD